MATSLAQQAPPGTQLTISGILLDAITGQPISSAEVALAPAVASSKNLSITTGDNGAFLFSNLAPGKYGLRAQRRGYLPAAFDEHDGYATSIAVGPDLESAGLIFSLQPESSISGRVSDETGEAVGEALVYLYQIGLEGGERRTSQRQQVTTDGEGIYHFAHLPPGTYLLAVTSGVWYAQRPEPHPNGKSDSYSTALIGMGGRNSAGNYYEDQGRSPLDVAYPITFYPGTSEPNAATPIVLKAGNRYVADMSLQPVPAVRIRVPVETRGRRGFGNSFVQLQTRMPDGSTVEVPAETRYRQAAIEVVGVAPGHYQMQVSAAGENSTARLSSINISNMGDVQVEHETPLLQVSAAIQVDPGSEMPNPLYLTLNNLETRESESGVESGTPGQVTFQRIAPGNYGLSVNTGNRDFVKALTAEGATVRGQTIEIKGPGPVKLNITVGHGHGEVKGVALRDGKPAAGVMIVLVPADPAHHRELFHRDQSDTDGTFTLSTVIPGKYTLLGLNKGWELEWTNPEVLKSYLPGGEIVQVQANGKYQVKVKVQ